MAKLLGRVRRKMLSVGLPAVLDDLDDNGAAPRQHPQAEAPGLTGAAGHRR